MATMSIYCIILYMSYLHSQLQGIVELLSVVFCHGKHSSIPYLIWDICDMLLL